MKQLITCIISCACLLFGHPLVAYDLLTDDQLTKLNELESTQTHEDEEYAGKTLNLTNTGPTIDLIKPKLDTPRINPPLDIELLFTAPENAEINKDSLRIFYKRWGTYFNVTETVLENATFEGDRLVSENVEIKKKGKHKIKVTIMDTLGRMSEKTFRFSM